MRPYEEMEYHPTSEKLVEILCQLAGNNNPMFFRIHVAYYLCVAASMMRCEIATPDRNTIPVNMYALNLSPSGTGKGRSTNLMEEAVLKGFYERFTDETLPILAEQNLPKLAVERAARDKSDPDVALAKVQKEFENLGPVVITFDSGTSPAVRQARQKLLMANAGSLNLQMDEVAVNLLGNMEVLNTFIELYDIGKIKQKLIKNTSENTRYAEISGRTPTNMMLFGTPTALMDGDKVEQQLYAMLDMGYARRCFFGYSRGHERPKGLSPQEILAQRSNPVTNTFIDDLSDRLRDLAGMSFMNKVLMVSEAVELLFIEYELACLRIVDTLPEHEEMRKAEIAHRHFKAKKLAGAYAFIDGSSEITEEHAYYAIKLAEDSGKAFSSLLTRDRPYVKLAKYIADIGRAVTQADLVDDLPFYRGSVSQKQEMMQLAIAHGYQNNILIRKSFNDGVEFLRGESLKVTDLTKIRLSYSEDIAHGYENDEAPFDKLHLMTQHQGIHWCNHFLRDGHRCEENAIPGFNIIVIDVEKSVPLQTAQMLLKDYKALFYTTRRHTDAEHRYRIILPTNFTLTLDDKDYKEFMSNVFDWLPFDVDRQTNQRARKWLSHDGHYVYQDGQVFDVLPFIPKTSKNEERKKLLADQQALDNLERWVINNTGDGNRNNMLLKYALILVDAGFDYNSVQRKVIDLNDKLPDKLLEAELMGTIMVTAGKAIAKLAA